MILIGRGLDLKEQFKIVGVEFQVNFLCSFQGVIEKDERSGSERVGDNRIEFPVIIA